MDVRGELDELRRAFTTLEDARQRAEDARQRAEDARQRAEDARQRAEDAHDTVRRQLHITGERLDHYLEQDDLININAAADYMRSLLCAGLVVFTEACSPNNLTEVLESLEPVRWSEKLEAIRSLDPLLLASYTSALKPRCTKGCQGTEMLVITLTTDKRVSLQYSNSQPATVVCAVCEEKFCAQHWDHCCYKLDSWRHAGQGTCVLCCRYTRLYQCCSSYRKICSQCPTEIGIDVSLPDALQILLPKKLDKGERNMEVHGGQFTGKVVDYVVKYRADPSLRCIAGAVNHLVPTLDARSLFEKTLIPLVYHSCPIAKAIAVLKGLTRHHELAATELATVKDAAGVREDHMVHEAWQDTVASWSEVVTNKDLVGDVQRGDERWSEHHGGESSTNTGTSNLVVPPPQPQQRSAPSWYQGEPRGAPPPPRVYIPSQGQGGYPHHSTSTYNPHWGQPPPKRFRGAHP